MPKFTKVNMNTDMIEDRELLLWPFPHQCHDCISNYITWMWHYNLEDDNGSHLKEKKTYSRTLRNPTCLQKPGFFVAHRVSFVREAWQT